MIHLSTGLRLGLEQPQLEQLAHTCDYLGIRTICAGTQPDWEDRAVKGVRRFLDAHGLRMGELSRFHGGLASPAAAAHQEALEVYRRYMAHAAILGAACVGFSFSGIYPADGSRGHEDVRSQPVWERVVEAAGDLAAAAAAAGVAIAAHPHQMGPLFSVERIARLLQEVSSPRLKVLIDPVNLVTLDTYSDTAPFLHHIFDTLGDSIVSVHAKDIILSALHRTEQGLLAVCHLDEAVPGSGNLDYATLLQRADGLGHDVVMHAEHLSSQDQRIVALHHIRHVAREQGITLG